jgi:FkbM family methyltransferase
MDIEPFWNKCMLTNYEKPILFDVGANRGDFSVLHHGEYKVVAVEANPEFIGDLTSRFAASDVSVESVALGSADGVVSFDVCTDRAMSSCNPEWLRTMRYSPFGILKSISVPCRTLDYLIEKYGSPSHIKIDVEGYEYEVLLGLSKKCGTIQFEFLSEYVEKITLPCLRHLSTLGYTHFSAKVSAGDYSPNHRGVGGEMIPIANAEDIDLS